MASVDDRVVRMEFDNAAFERRLATTMQSLSQLDKALKFTDGSKGLASVSDAAAKMDFRTVSAGIENVSKSFIALGTIAITTLANITTAAVRSGAQIAQSLTISPSLEGFREYETNMTSIQTILANTASKGTNLDQVTEALDRLNVYSDQTIYNFGQMARNIGTFTAAGVDLETSVNSIKGIANLAAMSGSTSEQASTAMYQLSQAIAAGSVKLMDWNSVVNAGMGGEAFKSALFETQKVMGNVLNVPVGQTFTEWEDAGNSFRETLQDGWITADVLTTTLAAFTGDMTEEMLLQKGFSEQQAANILKTAAIAKAAATEVKTFTQLMQTTKEAIGTGWADSFRIIIGNFTEAKELWTNVSEAVSGFVNRMADSRNQLLNEWKFFGGRTLLIESLKTAFQNVALALTPVREAFRDVFPAITSERLYEITAAFSRFATALQPTEETISRVKSIFEGFFSIIRIGWEILSEGVGFFIDLGKSIAEAFGGTAIDGVVTLADGISKLRQELVEGGKIQEFFNGLAKALEKPIELIKKFIQGFTKVFSAFDDGAGKKVSDTFNNITESFNNLGDAVGGATSTMWDPINKAFSKIGDLLGRVWNVVNDWLSSFGENLAKAMKVKDFDAVLDAINTALLGGIALMIAKFMKNGFSVDLGDGLLDKVGKSFEALTGYLQAMQSNVKANALLKIAYAIAVLTASVLVLSLINPERLTAALTAMAVGFGQLLAAFTLMTKMIIGPKTAATFMITATALIALGLAMLVLSVAVKILSTMSWDELARGLTGIIGLLLSLSVAVKPLAANSKGMIAAGIGITALSVGMVILASAMKIMATMSWEELGKGLTGVAVGLGVITAATRLMPKGPFMMLQGAGLLAIAVSLNIMAAAVAIFSTMSWEDLGKGMASIGTSLGLIAAAMNLMPVTTPIIAAGLILVGIALGEIAIAVGMFSGMSWEEIARGLTAMGGALLILAGGLFLMGQAGGGSASLIVAAIGLGLLAQVVKQFAGISWSDLAHGLGALAITLGSLALISVILSPTTSAITALGIALLILGTGLVLAGAGVYLLAQGLKTLGKMSEDIVDSVANVIKIFVALVPAVVKAVAKGIVEAIQVFVKAAPQFLEAMSKLIALLLKAVNDNLPALGDTIRDLIAEVLLIFREQGPPLIKTGIFLILSLLKGVRDKIGKVVELVADIIVAFLEAFRAEVPRVAKELADTIILWYVTAAYEIGRVAGTVLVGVGKAFIRGLIVGIDSETNGFMSRIISIPAKVLGWIGDTLSTLWQKGVDFLTGLWNGMIVGANAVYTFYSELPGKILGYFADAINWLAEVGGNIIQGLWTGMTNIWDQAITWISDIRTKIFDAFPSPGNILEWIGQQIFGGLWEGLKKVWVDIKAWVEDKVNWIKDAFKRALSIFSPSRVMMEQGSYIMEGLHIGMKDSWGKLERWMETTDPADKIKRSFGTNLTSVLSDMADKMSDISDFAPTITPVLDLSNVQRDASGIKKMMDANALAANFSFAQAQTVVKESKKPVDDSFGKDGQSGSEVSFIQNNYSPSALSASDIYKSTRNQITLAKEELKIP